MDFDDEDAEGSGKCIILFSSKLLCIHARFVNSIDFDDFADYDSDYEAKAAQGKAPATSIDPYAG